MKCRLCEHEWAARKEKPKSCPKCKRYDYDVVRINEKT